MNGIHEVTGSIPVWSTISFTSFSQWCPDRAQARGGRFASASGLDPGLSFSVLIARKSLKAGAVAPRELRLHGVQTSC